MAESEVALVNSGLIKIGENTITSLTQDTEAARKANQQYPIVRDRLLRSYRWNFAIRRADLALDPDKPLFGFDHQFSLPTDCLRVIGVFDEHEALVNYTSSRIQWKVENKGGALRLLTTQQVTKVFYIARVTNTTLFDTLFDEALAMLLGIDLAYVLSTGLDRLEQLRDQYKDIIKQARLNDAIEGKPEIIEATDWVDSRFHDFQFPPRIGPIIN